MDKIKRKKQTGILIAVTAAALLIAVIVAVIFSVSSDANEYDIHLEAAQKYLDELDYEQAVVELRMAIEIEPNNSAAYLTLAETYVAMGDYENALTALDEGYAATGDPELSAERERIAAELQEQERKEQEQQVKGFYEEYAELYTFATDEVFAGGRGQFDRYLTYTEREQVYGGVAEQLEQYLADLDEMEGLPDDLYNADWTGCGVDNITYFTQAGAYSSLSKAYLYMGKLEDCLRVRTEWAECCDRPDLVQDGNQGYDETTSSEYDRYGRCISYYYEPNDEQSYWIYGEPHDGATHWMETSPRELWEDDYTYDSEGRISHWHRVITREDEGVTVLDFDYAYTGNNSYVITYTCVNPDGHTEGPTQWEEQFYDEYGTEIYN